MAPTSPAAGVQRSWNGNETFVRHERAADAQADLLDVAALVGGLDLDLDRVGDVTSRSRPGRSHVTVGAVVSAVVGSR